MNDLYGSLKNREVTVTFTKVNGDQRIMKCTQNFELIPTDKYPQQNEMPSPINEEVCRVFDMEIRDWRSFRKDSVTEWK